MDDLTHRKNLKLAGQRMKFSKARALFYQTTDDAKRHHAAQLMAEVLSDASGNDFSESEVTQEADVPDEVRQLVRGTIPPRSRLPEDENPDDLAKQLRITVDVSSVIEAGEGDQFVYAYGYKCAPDRLKVGSCSGDVVARVAGQIGTGTPDKPVLLLTIRTHDCRALERVVHGILRLNRKQVIGAGAEWFIATPQDVLAIHEKIGKS